MRDETQSQRPAHRFKALLQQCQLLRLRGGQQPLEPRTLTALELLNACGSCGRLGIPAAQLTPLAVVVELPAVGEQLLANGQGV
jgi:hypothetical protein